MYTAKGKLLQNTGVMRISHESMFSGLNNIMTFDVFNDDVLDKSKKLIKVGIAFYGKKVSVKVSVG